MENLRKMNQTETLEIKSSLNQIKEYRGKQLQQTKTSGKRISGPEDKIDIKMENRRTLRKLKSWEGNM
jgi:hypothetical protein